MRRWLHTIEVIVDKAIPYLILILLFIIIGEFAFHSLIEKYRLYATIADYIIIGFFVIDLIFKFYRVRNVKLFFKKYWLEVIAVFPFILVFRLFEELAVIFRITGPLEEGQKVLHGVTEVTKIGEEQKIIRELQQLEKGTQTFRSIQEGTRLSRTSMFLKFLRLPRLARAVPIYEKPIKKEIKIIEKEISKDLGLKKRR
ncbi:ion transporter [Candidatus Woesearchaeota archaeon]|nr:ion transporter [Candidatus Woesearchaeota archaeon]